MIAPDALRDGLVVVGQGEADEPQPDLFEPRLRTTVRYADPAAWVTAAAVARALAPLRQAAAVPPQAGLVVSSAHGPTEAMATIEEAARAGYSSPMRYPASNPGSLTGVSCIAFGLQGPTLNLVIPPRRGVPLGLLVAGGWLRRGVTPLMAVAACARRDPAGLRARCLWLSCGESSPVAAGPLSEAHVAWLSLAPE
jgi:hypothetical protein